MACRTTVPAYVFHENWTTLPDRSAPPDLAYILHNAPSPSLPVYHGAGQAGPAPLPPNKSPTKLA